MSEAAGTTLMETLRIAAEALRRQRFAELVAAQLAELRRDPGEWLDYLTDSERTAVVDGIG